MSPSPGWPLGLLQRLFGGPPARDPPRGARGRGEHEKLRTLGFPLSPLSAFCSVLLAVFCSFKVSLPSGLWGIGRETDGHEDFVTTPTFASNCEKATPSETLGWRCAAAGCARPCQSAMCCAGVTRGAPPTKLSYERTGLATLCWPSGSPPLPSSIAPWEGLPTVGALFGRGPSLATGPLARSISSL